MVLFITTAVRTSNPTYSIGCSETVEAIQPQAIIITMIIYLLKGGEDFIQNTEVVSRHFLTGRDVDNI
jgi:hypothetical protein